MGFLLTLALFFAAWSIGIVLCAVKYAVMHKWKPALGMTVGWLIFLGLSCSSLSHFITVM